MLLEMVACWLPTAPQPGGRLCSNETCFVSFSYSRIKGKGKKTVTLFAVTLLCDRISGLEGNVG